MNNLISKCCGAKAHYVYNDVNDGYWCEKCEKTCDIECETCGGTKEVTTMETVYAGESHQAPIGTGICPDCFVEKDEEYDDQE